MKSFSYALLMFLMFAAPAFASVSVGSPANGETVSSSVHYVADSSTNTCGWGVASMGVYVDNNLTYVVNGTHLDTTLPISPGRHHTVVEEWDYCGGATYTSADVTSTNQPGIWVSSPANNSTVGTSVNYAATATNNGCWKGVAAMGIYVNNRLVTIQNGAKLNTQVNLGPGQQHTVVQEWDNCGGSSYVPVVVNVKDNGPGDGQGGTTLSDLQAKSGWKSWGQFAPYYEDCTSNCWGVNWSSAQNVSSPSMSGHATRFTIGGSVPYSDVLWSNPLIGQGSTQGVPDHDHTLLPNLHYFTYDADVFVTNTSVTQNLEFDISMYMNGAGMIWGTQCDHLGDGQWDIWDNVNAHWVPSGIPCNLVNNAWNHVTLQMQRRPDNTLLYQSITLNGKTYNLNRTYAPFSVPGGWWGLTVNYQMDGDRRQSTNTTYLDNLSLTYR